MSEIVEHLFLAELGGITKIWSALGDVKAGRRWSGDLPNRGRSIEDVVAATWQPRQAAPAVAVPHLGGPLAAWIAALRALTPVLQALAVRLRADDGKPRRLVVTACRRGRGLSRVRAGARGSPRDGPNCLHRLANPALKA